MINDKGSVFFFLSSRECYLFDFAQKDKFWKFCDHFDSKDVFFLFEVKLQTPISVNLVLRIEIKTFRLLSKPQDYIETWTWRLLGKECGWSFTIYCNDHSLFKSYWNNTIFLEIFIDPGLSFVQILRPSKSLHFEPYDNMKQLQWGEIYGIHSLIIRAFLVLKLLKI